MVKSWTGSRPSHPEASSTKRRSEVRSMCLKKERPSPRFAWASEALSRYRRGGEQRVVVQHIADKIAVVNNFGGTEGEGSHKNKGASPCP